MSRESVYDAEIFPLMKQIIDVCKKNGIPFICDFALDDDLKCTSVHLPKDSPEQMLQAYRVIKPGMSGLKITTKDKDGKIVNQTVVIN